MKGIFAIYSEYDDIFAIIGAVFCCFLSLKVFVHIFRAFRSFLLAPLLNLGIDPLKLGSWAVVTGATDGIGKSHIVFVCVAGLLLL